MSAGRGDHRLNRVVVALIGVAAVIAGLAAAAGVPTRPPTAVAQVPTCPADITFGQAIICTIGAPGEVDSYSFPGAVGEQIRVRVIETAGTLVAEHDVRRPNGTSACAFTVAEERPCLLDTTGVHTIRIRDFTPGTRTGDYTLYAQRFPNPVGCAALTFGTFVTGTIGPPPGEADCYTFSAATGDRIRVRVIETSGMLAADQEVIGPSGTTPAGCARSVAEERTCLLDATGLHTILVRDFTPGTRAGDYTLHVQRFPNPAGCSELMFGVPVAGTIGPPPGEADCYTFSATAGDRVRLRVIETAGTLAADHEVIAPSGTTPAGCERTVAEERTCLLDATGMHTVLVRDFTPGTRTGDYTLYAQRFPNPVGCAAVLFGTSVTEPIGPPPGEAACHIFPGTMGDQVRIRVIETAGTLVADQEVIAPSGTTPAGCARTIAQERTCLLDATGLHTILVRDVTPGSRAGSYQLTLECVSGDCMVGGRQFGLSTTAGGVALSWAGGSGQAGYQVYRIPLDGSPPALLPAAGPLPPTATSFVDATAAPGSLPCYLLIIYGPMMEVLGISDLLCRFDGVRAGNPPADFTLRLYAPGSAGLSWLAVPGASGYLLLAIPLTGAPARVQTLGAEGTATTDAIGADFTCYAVAALGVADNLSDLACGLTGVATLAGATPVRAGPAGVAQVAQAVRRAAGADPVGAARRAVQRAVRPTPTPTPTTRPMRTPRPTPRSVAAPRPAWCAGPPQSC
jgi:hypothetical protein